MISLRRKFYSQPGDSAIMWGGPLWFFIVLKMTGSSTATDIFWTIITIAALIGWFFTNWEIQLNKK